MHSLMEGKPEGVSNAIIRGRKTGRQEEGRWSEGDSDHPVRIFAIWGRKALHLTAEYEDEERGEEGYLFTRLPWHAT